jgi:pyruvate dehydrogenase E2 component (dihydrolipoamide acetyltransferase)
LRRALAWLEDANRERPPTERLLPAVLFLKASALALHKVPELNGFWLENGFRVGAGIHVGWAISLRGGGLIAPAIHDNDQKSLAESMAAMRDLAQRARADRLRSSELTDPTITRNQSRRARRGDGDRRPLPAAGRDHRLRPDRRAALAVDGALAVRPEVSLSLAPRHDAPPDRGRSAAPRAEHAHQGQG